MSRDGGATKRQTTQVFDGDGDGVASEGGRRGVREGEVCCGRAVRAKEMVILGLEPRTTALLALRSTD